MFNITDILSLGTDYTVADQNGNIIKIITTQTIIL